MKRILPLAIVLLLLSIGTVRAQVTLFSEDFETGGPTFALNSTDLGGTSTPNFWIINNAYTGGNGSLVCMGFPFTYTIQNTPLQTFHGNTTSNYLHTMSIYGQADNIFCSSFAAADGFCIFNSSNICKLTSGINTTGYSNVNLKFYWNCSGGTAIYGEVYYSINGGSTWNLITTPISQYKNQGTWVQQTISMAAFDNVADLRFAFRFVNNQSSSALDPGFSIDDIEVIGSVGAATTITTGTVSNLSVCPGDQIQVPYTITGTFTPGNTFTAELSNASGSFASPVSIGSTSSTSAGTITCTIPLGTPAGAGYRIRVVGSTPPTTGTTNVANITVEPSAVGGTASATPANLCQGGSAQLSLTGASGSILWESSPNGTNWTSTGQTNNPSTFVLSATTYYRALLTSACDSAYSNTFSVSVTPTNDNFAHALLSRDSICDGDTTTVQMVYWGSSITWYTSTDGGSTWNLSANTHPGTYHTPPLAASNANHVRAIVDNGVCGFDTIEVAIAVEAVSAAFSSSNSGLTYTFTDGSTNAVTWAWDFGDGNTSTQQNPVHTYASGGNYTVTLTVTSPSGCVATTSQTVSVPVGMAAALWSGLQVRPNPFHGHLEIGLVAAQDGRLTITLHDLQGKEIKTLFEGDVVAGPQQFRADDALARVAAGAYLLRLTLAGEQATVRILKLE